MPPAAHRSAPAARSASSRSAVSVTVSASTGQRWLRLASLLARRTAERAAAATSATSGSPSTGSSATVGHAARWTEPSCHQRPDLLGDEGQERGEQPLQRRQRQLERGPRRGLARRVGVAVGPLLDQLEVVVAERPEERLGALERPGVVVAVERLGGLGDEAPQRGQHGQVERLRWATAPAGASPMAESELGGVEQLDGEAAADLELVGVEGGVGAGPGRARPVAHGVGAVLLEQAHRRDDVALRLRHLLAVGVEDPAVDAWCRPTAGRRARSGRGRRWRTARCG